MVQMLNNTDSIVDYIMVTFAVLEYGGSLEDSDRLDYQLPGIFQVSLESVAG